MKTNRIFVCQYCDKNLSSKRTVKMHITNQHKADPDNPPMYHVRLVSPGEVNKMLNRVNTGTENVKNTAVENVPVTAAENVKDNGTENVTETATEKVIGPETETDEIVEHGADQVTDNLINHGIVTNTTRIDLGKVKPKKTKKPKLKVKLKKEKDNNSCYDFKRLSNHFSKPDLGQDLIRRSSTKPQTGVTNITPMSVQSKDPINSHQGPKNSHDHLSDEQHLPHGQVLPPNHLTGQVLPPNHLTGEGLHPHHLTGEGQVLLPHHPTGEGQGLQPHHLAGEGQGLQPHHLAGESQGLQPHHLAGEGQVLPPHLMSEGQVLPGHLISGSEIEVRAHNAVSAVKQTLAPSQLTGEVNDLPLHFLSGGHVQPSNSQVIVSQITSDGQVILHHVDGPGQFLPPQPQGYNLYPLNFLNLLPPHPCDQTILDGDPPCEQPMSGSSTLYDQSAHQSLLSTLQRQKRSAFTVPYSKRPRGKCTDWLNCENCSLDVDCGECRNCLDKSLQ